MKILIHREGQQFGPYSIAEVQSYLAAGQLQPTDSAWHEGLPDWIPLDQIAGAVGTASAPPPPPPSRLSLPLDSPHEPKYAKKQCPRCQATVDMDAVLCTNCGTHMAHAQKESVVAQRYLEPIDEETTKDQFMMSLGALLLFACVAPVYTGTNWDWFPNFHFKGASWQRVFMGLWPGLVGVFLLSSAQSVRAPVRSGIVLGMGAAWFIVNLTMNADAAVAGLSPLMVIFQSKVSGLCTGVGWVCLVFGAGTRYFLPGSKPACVLAMVGGGFIVLSWVLPHNGIVPLAEVFKSFKVLKDVGDNWRVLFIPLLAMFSSGMQIGAAALCFFNTPGRQLIIITGHSALAVKLLIGSVVVTMLLAGFAGASLTKEFLFAFLGLAKVAASTGLTLLLPLGAIDLTVGNARR